MYGCAWKPLDACEFLRLAVVEGRNQQEDAHDPGLSFSTKRLAPLADGAATASSAGTTILATVVCEQPQQPLWKQRLHRPFLEVRAAFAPCRTPCLGFKRSLHLYSEVSKASRACQSFYCNAFGKHFHKM